MQKRNKPIASYLSEELKFARTESSKIDKQIAGRKLSMEETRKRFTDERARFIALKQPVTSNAALAVPTQAVTEASEPATETNKLQTSKTLSKN